MPALRVGAKRFFVFWIPCCCCLLFLTVQFFRAPEQTGLALCMGGNNDLRDLLERFCFVFFFEKYFFFFFFFIFFFFFESPLVMNSPRSPSVDQSSEGPGGVEEAEQVGLDAFAAAVEHLARASSVLASSAGSGSCEDLARGLSELPVLESDLAHKGKKKTILSLVLFCLLACFFSSSLPTFFCRIVGASRIYVAQG